MSNLNNLIIIITLFVLGICIFMYIENVRNDLVYVKSKVDNKEYLVQRFEDSDKAADLIAEVKQVLMKLIELSEKNHPDNEAVKRMKKKFNPNVIVEVGKKSKYTSYSVNKGEKLVLCLRSRDGENKLIDKNTLLFVAIHELAHIMTLSIGHTDEFWNNFKFLLKEAVKSGLYKKVDYSEKPKEYCGISVNSI